jgi:hypothetical protein
VRCTTSEHDKRCQRQQSTCRPSCRWLRSSSGTGWEQRGQQRYRQYRYERKRQRWDREQLKSGMGTKGGRERGVEGGVAGASRLGPSKHGRLHAHRSHLHLA